MYECQSKPKIRINLESPDGNIFVVLASAANAIKRYNIHNGDKYIAEMKKRVLMNTAARLNTSAVVN